MEVPRSPRLYVLGSFARYVTVYAQQVRAFNLVDALVKNGVLTTAGRVAVVGGGIAGVTAGAACAVRGAARVVVYEKLNNTMRIQRATEKRYIHPHIYDWPADRGVRQLNDDAPAGHAIMDWTANRADHVVAQLTAGFKALVAHRNVLVRTNCGPIAIERDGDRWSVGGEMFDIVVLAVGFGRDGVEAGTESYWTDTSLDGLEHEQGGTWFVSGYGDGGLTDLMRLCVSSFRHEAVLRGIDAATRDKVGDDLRALAAGSHSPERLAKEFMRAAEIVAPELDETLPDRAALGDVYLNCGTEAQLFSGPSSVLNRLIVAYLLHDGRFQLLPQAGRVILPFDRSPDGRFAIRFADPQSPVFAADHVVVRHGPRTALAIDFPQIYERCDDLRAQWASARQLEDWTREPLYDQDAFALGMTSRIRTDYGERIGCVVISAGTPLKPTAATRVGAALIRLRQRTGNHEIATTPVEISAVEALASPAAYEWTVRALCDADIAVFDITGFESAVMLFLGVRSAVRRGVTLTVGPPRTDDAEPLPFNLIALSPIEWDRDDRKRIADAMEAGRASLKRQGAAYLDLPAFDAVRQLGDDYLPIPQDEQVLVLRWFDEAYTKVVKEVIKDILLEAGVKEDTDIVTTLDSSSPQLVPQRLYALIRRVRLCVVDWTGWRPNVFFELGVRLAVSPDDPVCLLCRDADWDREQPSAQALRHFFGPIEFDFAHGYGGAGQEVGRLLSTGATRGVLSRGRTYAVISDAIPRDLEPGGRSLHSMLLAQAKQIAGPATPEEGHFPLLYADVLTDQALTYAVELLIAAWHYLDRGAAINGKGIVERLRGGEDVDPEALEALRTVGQELSGRLRLVQGRRYRGFARELRGMLAILEKNWHG